MRGVEAETIAEMVRAYAEAMQGVPLWAAQAASANCRSGRVAFNAEFAPSAATLATEARRLWNDARAKEAAARPKLTPPSVAETMTVEQRAVMAERLRNVLRDAVRPASKDVA